MTWRIGLTAILLAALTACGGAAPTRTAPPSAPGSDHADHTDPVAEAVKTELTQRLGMQFESAGPHHTLGKAPDGVQLDLVGVPVEEVVLSIPGNDPTEVRRLADSYIGYPARLLQTSSQVGRDLLYETLAAWDGRTPLDRRRSGGGISARVTSTADPAWVVLAVSRDSR